MRDWPRTRIGSVGKALSPHGKLQYQPLLKMPREDTTSYTQYTIDGDYHYPPKRQAHEIHEVQEIHEIHESTNMKFLILAF